MQFVRIVGERRRGRILRLLVTVLGALPLLGCMQLPYTELVKLNQAKQDYQKKDYNAATAKLDKIVKNYPQNPGSAEAYYVRSLCHTRMSNKAQAESDARKCLKLSRDPDLTADAHATMATLLYESDRTREAMSHFSEAFKNERGRSNEDVLIYRYALCLQREGQWKEARIQFQQVYEQFPNTTSAQHAKRLYDWRHDYYSIQCGAYRDQDAASMQNRRLQRAGLRSRVERQRRRGELLHTVYVGKYTRYGQAKDALPSVRRQVPDAFVIPQ